MHSVAYESVEHPTLTQNVSLASSAQFLSTVAVCSVCKVPAPGTVSLCIPVIMLSTQSKVLTRLWGSQLLVIVYLSKS